MSHRILIPCNPVNPVNYLACCGLFDLLARIDGGALGWWNFQRPATFMMESAVPESDFLSTLVGSLSSASLWRFGYARSGGSPVQISVTFLPPGKAPFAVSLDWWFETAEFDGVIREKSAWKMYAGQQTVAGITQNLLEAAAHLSAQIHAQATVAQLLDVSAEMTGRFGFDPRSSRNALDLGYSPNDLGLPVPTFVFAELLATFALPSFFPSRTGATGSLQSTRGWRPAGESEGETGFTYCLWSEPLPVSLARLAAVRPIWPGGRTLFSSRAKRKDYANLTSAITTQPT